MVSGHECQVEDSESEEVQFLSESESECVEQPLSRPIEPPGVGDSVHVLDWIPGHIIRVGSTSDVKDGTVTVAYKIAGKDRTEIMFAGSKFLSFVPAETRVES